MIAVSFSSFASEKHPQSVSPIGTEVAVTEYFLANEGFTLWATFIAEKRPRKEWPKYWQDACVLSQIPCTDVAWKNIQVGQKITISPRSPEEILTADHASVVASELATQAQNSEVLIAQKNLLAAQETVAILKLRAVLTAISFVIFAICALVLCGLLLARIFKLRRENAILRNVDDDEFPVLPMSDVIDTSRMYFFGRSGKLPLDIAQDAHSRSATGRAEDDDLACRSIELTCEYVGLFKTATDQEGLRYHIDDRTIGPKAELRPGDIFYAEVSNTNTRRVVMILSTVL